MRALYRNTLHVPMPNPGHRARILPVIQRKKSLAQYSREKREREGKPLYALQSKPAVGRHPSAQAKKHALPCASAMPKKALRRQSKRMGREMDAYHGQRAVFLQRFPVCGACLARDLTPTASAQIHHSRGKWDGNKLAVFSTFYHRYWTHEAGSKDEITPSTELIPNLDADELAEATLL